MSENCGERYDSVAQSAHRSTKEYSVKPGLDTNNPILGALQTKLDVHRQPPLLPYDRLYEKDALPALPLNLESLADFFRYSLALSAWKEYGSSRWALRINPSSGNLHPTEAYALLPPLTGIPDAPTLCHYLPQLHSLERRASLSLEVWQQNLTCSKASCGQTSSGNHPST